MTKIAYVALHMLQSRTEGEAPKDECEGNSG